MKTILKIVVVLVVVLVIGRPAHAARTNVINYDVTTVTNSTSNAVLLINGVPVATTNSLAAFASSTNALNTRVGNIETATNTLQLSVTSLITATGTLNTAVSALQGSTGALNTAVSALQASTSTLNTAVASLVSSTSLLYTATIALGNATNALNTRVGSLEASTNAMNTRLALTITNTQTGVTLDGTFSGDGSGLSGLVAASTNGIPIIAYNVTNPTPAVLIVTNAPSGSHVVSGNTSTVYVASSSDMSLVTNILLTGTAASISFTNIPQTYNSLVIDFNGRMDAASASERLEMRFNNDSGNNYDSQFYRVAGASAFYEEGDGVAYYHVGYMPAASAAAQLGSGGRIVVPGYTNTNFIRSAFSQSNLKDGAGTGKYHVINTSGFWRTNLAVNVITLFPVSGNFEAGSTFHLYGVR